MNMKEKISRNINQFKNSIAVAGCHGKSSTSAMITHMLQACTHNASMHIGAKDKVYNNFYCDYLLFIRHA